jgi:hypothetical protein
MCKAFAEVRKVANPPRTASNRAEFQTMRSYGLSKSRSYKPNPAEDT